MKNYIEQVTNPERETVKYVPKKYFDELFEMFFNLEIYDEVYSSISSIKYNAYLNEIEKPIIPDDPKTERSIDVCPYCGDKMEINLESKNSPYRNYYSSIEQRNGVIKGYYKCLICGSVSPKINIRTCMIDGNIFKTDMVNAIKDYNEIMDEEDDIDERKGF